MQFASFKSSTLRVFRLVLLASTCTAATAQAQTINLDTVEVQSGGQKVEGYVAKQSVTATKTDTPILEIPQAISIIPEKQIEEQQAQTIVEALRYTPSITVDSYSSGTFFDEVKIRGFKAPQYLDGLLLPIDPGTQFAIPRIEPYSLERIEVLKGPSSGLYGRSEPGGLLNMTSKRPTSTPFAEIEGQYGSYERFQGAFDFGGPVDKDGHLLYRFTGLARDSDTQLDFAEDNKLFIAPSFTWAPTAATSFTFLSQYSKSDNRGLQQYVPGIGSLLPNPHGRIPYSRYLGEPDAENYTLEYASAGYDFEHRFDNGLKFHQNLRYATISNDVVAGRSEGITPNLEDALRTINYVNADSKSFTIDNNLQADFATGPLQHKVLVGLDYQNIESHSDYRSTMIDPINIFNPIYGVTPIPPRNSLPPFILNDAKQIQTGVYAQDQIKLDRWTLSLTGRHDWATTENDDQAVFPPPGVTSRDDTAFTGRVGLSYLFDFGLAPYISYATSFQPASGVDLAGNTFKPVTGEAKEIGVKYQPTGMNLLLTAALFDIEQRDILTVDPANPFFNTQTNDARVRGFEFEARGNITRELEIIGGYSKLDPKITASVNPGVVGNYMTNVAVDQAALWAKYTWYNGPLAGLGIAGGIRYIGENYGDEANTIRIPSYTLYDAAIYYDFQYIRPDWKGLTAQINARNIGNEYYVTSCAGSLAYCSLGSARSVLFTLKYQWM